MDLILASGSPRRRELLAALGIPFTVITADVPELDAASAPHLKPAALAEANALLKAQAVGRALPTRWILGADTVVALGNRLFGKPADLHEASTFLRAFSGETHQVITGCALLQPGSEAQVFHEVTHVTFRRLAEADIARYLAHVPVLDKAGGYALQQHGDWIVARVEGSRDNVIGLPTEKLMALLSAGLAG